MKGPGTVRRCSRRSLRRGRAVRSAALLCFPLCFAGGVATSAEFPLRTGTPDLSGSLRAVHDYRRLDTEKDSDGYAYWHLRARNLAQGRLEVYTSGRLHEDFDGTGTAYSEDPFVGMEDTSRESDVRVLQAYADLHDRDLGLRLRLGRQYVDVADYIQMDGAQAMLFERRRLGGRLFLGQPVSFYTPISGDLFGGVSMVGRPWSGNRTRLTFARYEDDSENKTDNHFFLDIRQQVQVQLRLRAYFSVMNEDFRLGGADLYHTSGDSRVFDLALGVRRWGVYEAHTRAYSPLVAVLGEQEPYTHGYGRLTGEILPWLFISPGITLRYPDNSNAQNRQYGRYDLTFIFEPNRAWNASVAGEYWNVKQGDRFFGLSGEVRYRKGKVWEVAAGAAYLDYQYRRFSDFALSLDGGTTVLTSDGVKIELSPDVYTYFLRGKWNISKNLFARVHGEIEDDAEEEGLGYRLRSSLEVRL